MYFNDMQTRCECDMNIHIFRLMGFLVRFSAEMGLSRLSSDACLSQSHSNKRYLPSVETNNHVPPPVQEAYEARITTKSTKYFEYISGLVEVVVRIKVIKCMSVFAYDFSHSTKNPALYSLAMKRMLILIFKEIIQIVECVAL